MQKKKKEIKQRDIKFKNSKLQAKLQASYKTAITNLLDHASHKEIKLMMFAYNFNRKQ